MRPENCPDYWWIRCIETAVIGSIGTRSFWAFARSERTIILLAALDAIPEGVSSTTVDAGNTAYMAVRDAALIAAREVIQDRRTRKLLRG